jgi:putative ABC transport system permease protein
MTIVREALRALRASRAYAVWVVAILGIGAGAAAAVFTILERTVLRPLPYAASQQLVKIWEEFSAFGTPHVRVSPAMYVDLSTRMRSMEVAAYGMRWLNLTGGGPAEETEGLAASGNLLPMLGVAPDAGRFFSNDEERAGAAVVVLSNSLARRRFGDARAAVGRTVRMNDRPFTIVGVMPPWFQFPDARVESWIPLSLSPEQAARRNSHYLHAVGRIRDGATLDEARAEASAFAQQLASAFPSTNDRVGLALIPLKEDLLGGADRPLTALMATALCVFLIACVNVAGLALARGSHRRTELAVRAALGASWRRIAGETAAEAAILGVACGASAFMMARIGVQALMWLVPRTLPIAPAALVDARAALVPFVAGVTAAIATAAPAAVFASRASLVDTVERSSTRIAGGSLRVRHMLLGVQVALAIVLLCGAALMIGTLARLARIDPGFDASHVFTARVAIAGPTYQDASVREAFFGRLLADVRQLPGVQRAGLTSDLPFTSRGNTMAISVEHRAAPRGPGEDALFRLVSAQYLETIGARLIAGRLLKDDDTRRSTPVVVVSEAFVRRYLADRPAIGRRINSGTGTEGPLWMTVVGIVADVRERGLDLAPLPTVYVPFTQTAITFFQPSELAIRTSVPPMAIAASVQRIVQAIDPDQPLVDVRDFASIVARDQEMRRNVFELLTACAILALVLAGFGIYSVLSYLVTLQRKEIAVRLALGASAARVIRGTVSRTMRATLAGAAAGAAGTVTVMPVLRSLLFEISPLDPRALGGATLLVLLIAAAAAYWPSRRAAALEPAKVLRGV